MLQKILKLDLVPKIILTLIVLLPIFFLPVTFFALNYSKFILFYTLTFIALIIFLVGLLYKKESKFYLNIFSVSVFLIIISYTLSTIFSKNFHISLIGRDFSQDSWLTIVSLFSLMFLISFVFKKDLVLKAVFSVIMTAGLVSLIQILNLLIPSLPSLGLFYSPSNNLIGKLNDLALFATLGSIVGVIALENLKLSFKFKYIIYFTLAINLLLILLINFYLSLYILLGVGVIYLSYNLFFLKKIKESIFSPVWIIVIFSLVSIFFATSVNDRFLNKISMDYLEVRPSISTTVDITKKTLENYPVLGAGPGAFEVLWPMYRPLNVLSSNFWNLDFRYGHGIVMSFVATTGIVGALAWVLFMVCLVFFVFKAIFTKTDDHVTKFLIDSTAIVSLSLWVIATLYISTIVIYALAFIFSGLFLSILKNENIINQRKFYLNPSIIKIWSVVGICLVVVFGFFVTEKFIANLYFQKVINASENEQDITTIKKIAENAVLFSGTDVNYRALAMTDSVILFKKISETKTQLRAEELNVDIAKIVEYFEKAIKYDPNNYFNYLEFANFYSELVGLNLSKEASYQTAKNLYAQSEVLKPSNPFINIRKSRLEFLNNNYQNSKDILVGTIALKPDYLDAYVALSQVELAQGNVSASIKTLEEYVKVFPNNIQGVNQLALIYIETENYQKAVDLFVKVYGEEQRDEIDGWIEQIKIDKNFSSKIIPQEDISNSSEQNNIDDVEI